MTAGDYASTIGSEEGGDAASFAAQSFALPRIARATNAGDELDQLCKSEFQSTLSDAEKSLFPGFPLKCLPIVKLLPGNHCCVDCGDQEQEGLVYGSVGYGTLLCKECAFRHITNTEEQSEVKSLTDDIWDLHSILSLFEGGNTQMLEYIKDKPRWRAKGKSNKEDYSEDVISFKQIYLSKAATAYRTNLANKVEHLYQNRMEALKEDATKREERAIKRSIKNRNPFMNILEMNDVSPDDIPGIFNNVGFRKYAPRTTRIIKEEEEGPSSATAYTPDAAQVDRIKQRINAKFSRNGSTGDYSNSREGQPRNNPHQEDYPPTRHFSQAQGGRRRSIDLVGEVGGVFIQGQDEDISTKFVTDTLQTEDLHNTEKPQIREFWLHHQEDQRYNNTHAPRSNAILGTYNRRGSGGTPEAPRRQQSSMESSRRSSHAPQRPQFRPPQID
jgi:hypothetical protein